MRRTGSVLMAALVWALVASPATATDLEVAELVEAIKRGIADAQKNAKQPPTMRIPWIEAEISYVVKQEGGAGLKLYVVTVDGKYAVEAVQRVKYRLEPTGPVKVEAPGELSGPIAGVDKSAGKVFISAGPAFAKTGPTFPVRISGTTQIVDAAGAAKSVRDLKAGTDAKVIYQPTSSGEVVANRIVIKP